MTQRLNSIDALRGLTVAAMLVVNDAGDWNHVYPWLEHADWNGCSPADFIFPFFLLIVGVSISLALGPKLDASAEHGALARNVLWRGLRIVLLGLALHYIAALLIPGRAFRLLGVLQRIGICFTVAGLLPIYCKNARVQWAILGGILLGYWALLAFGGSTGNPYTPDLNLPDRIDTTVLGPLAYTFDPASGCAHDPEGVLSTLGALATVILGVRVGSMLRAGQLRHLCVLGMTAVALGGMWSMFFPLNKQLWTSSFVLWTGGFGMLLILLAHQLIDVRGWPALGRSLGINAIAAYAGSWVTTCMLAGSGVMGSLYTFAFERSLAPIFGANVPSLAFALAFTAAFWLLAVLCAKRGWHITI